MLTLTDNARTAVETLTSRAGLPQDGGLRIAEQETGGFELALVAGPDPDDDVVAQGDARVYVDPRTSQTLAEQQLDVEATDSGATFTLTRQ
ncbi:adhesin [Cellulomonas sp. S1-8]|uniref:adhesin n=1 Tax=Cellulomonas sp. S1-8 TaxID=2904790 RepID=UPI0022444FD8|nr:adhesin [Cellulomonas sp. S1-8]UZN02493.1 adhesin [Cellulomonas sp. S1-8]